jgi:murein DD-endopeptidase MepM/ murein hydrolase activator NlpD
VKHFLQITYLLLAFFVVSDTLVADEAKVQLFVQNNAKQGGIITAFIYPAHTISSATFVLVNSVSKRVAYTPGVRYSPNESNQSVMLALLGLYPNALSGNFTLEVEATTLQNTKLNLNAKIKVAPSEYRTTTVKMGNQGTAVQNTRNIEREEQAKRFYATLAAFNADANYFTRQFSKPINQEKFYITGRFWDRRRIIYADGKVENGVPHNGIDYAGMPIGTPVLAVGDGRVSLAENRIITGHTVIIEHFSGVFSLYYHMDNSTVKVGDIVKTGQLIGHLGNTGFSTGPHIHLGARVSNVDIDPNWLLDNPLIDDNFIKEVIT